MKAKITGYVNKLTDYTSKGGTEGWKCSVKENIQLSPKEVAAEVAKNGEKYIRRTESGKVYGNRFVSVMGFGSVPKPSTEGKVTIEGELSAFVAEGGDILYSILADSVTGGSSGNDLPPRTNRPAPKKANFAPPSEPDDEIPF